MKMSLKLEYYAFSLPPFVIFLHFLLKFKPFDEFFPFQNMIANLCVCVSTSIE